MTALLRRPWLALLAALVIETVIFVLGQADFVAADPLWYADIAHNLAVDPARVFAAQENHPFVMRIGLTFPLALLYRLFGVSTLVTNLPGLFAALGITAVAYAAMPSARGKLLALLICVASKPLLQNAAILNVDLPCAALMAASVLFLSRRWLVAAVIAWFAAFLVKETALWCAPVWLYAIGVDLRESGRRALLAYVPAFVVGVVLAGAYLWLCARVWGNAFARFQGISDLTYEHTWSLHGKPTSEWVARLTWQTPWMLLQMFHVTLILAALAAWLVRGKQNIIWLVATATFVGLYWFGSSSMSAYNPLPISPRMAMPVLPGILVLAALATDRLLDRFTDARWRLAFVVGLVIALLVPTARAVRAMIVRGRPETAAFAIVREEVARGGRVIVVCGEPRCIAVGNFYFGLELPPNVLLIYAGDFARAPKPEGASVRALVNLNRAAGARKSNQDMTGPIEALQLPPLAVAKRVKLYDAGDGARLWDALQ